MEIWKKLRKGYVRELISSSDRYTKVVVTQGHFFKDCHIHHDMPIMPSVKSSYTVAIAEEDNIKDILYFNLYNYKSFFLCFL